MRFDIVISGPDNDGFYAATVVAMGYLVAREYRRCLDRAKRAALHVVADCDDVTEIHVTDWQVTA